jgi:hypothetical protein
MKFLKARTGRSSRVSAALLISSWALSAQVQPGQNPLDTQPRFPLATPVEAVKGEADPLTLAGKTDYWIKSAVSPESLTRVALFSLPGTIGGINEEWGTGTGGYTRRLASRYAGHFAGSTVRYGIGVIRGEDPRYYKSGKEGLWARTGFAVSRSFVTKMDDGSTSVAVGKLAGTVSSNIVQTHMRPYGQDPFKTAILNSGVGLTSDIGKNIVREFWPDIKRLFKK